MPISTFSVMFGRQQPVDMTEMTGNVPVNRNGNGATASRRKPRKNTSSSVATMLSPSKCENPLLRYAFAGQPITAYYGAPSFEAERSAVYEDEEDEPLEDEHHQNTDDSPYGQRYDGSPRGRRDSNESAHGRRDTAESLQLHRYQNTAESSVGQRDEDESPRRVIHSGSLRGFASETEEEEGEGAEFDDAPSEPLEPSELLEPLEPSEPLEPLEPLEPFEPLVLREVGVLPKRSAWGRPRGRKTIQDKIAEQERRAADIERELRSVGLLCASPSLSNTNNPEGGRVFPPRLGRALPPRTTTVPVSVIRKSPAVPSPDSPSLPSSPLLNRNNEKNNNTEKNNHGEKNKNYEKNNFGEKTNFGEKNKNYEKNNFGEKNKIFGNSARNAFFSGDRVTSLPVSTEQTLPLSMVSNFNYNPRTSTISNGTSRVSNVSNGISNGTNTISNGSNGINTISNGSNATNTISNGSNGTSLVSNGMSNGNREGVMLVPRSVLFRFEGLCPSDQQLYLQQMQQHIDANNSHTKLLHSASPSPPMMPYGFLQRDDSQDESGYQNRKTQREERLSTKLKRIKAVAGAPAEESPRGFLSQKIETLKRRESSLQQEFDDVINTPITRSGIVSAQDERLREPALFQIIRNQVDWKRIRFS